MNSRNCNSRARSIHTMVPIILRITFSLLLWSLGAASMNLAAAEAQPKEQRVVVHFPIVRGRIENLQRWVNSGHDPWCRDPQLVASAALRRVSPQFPDLELTTLPVQLESSEKTTAIYTFHSIDGATLYRITLRRYHFLLPTAGSMKQVIWVPRSAEIITRDKRE